MTPEQFWKSNKDRYLDIAKTKIELALAKAVEEAWILSLSNAVRTHSAEDDAMWRERNKWRNMAIQLAEHADELEDRLIAIGLDNYDVDSVPFDPEAHWETAKGR